MKVNIFYIVIIAALLAIILLQRSCNKCPSPASVTKTDTVYVTVRDTFVDEHPIPIEVFNSTGQLQPITLRDTFFSVIKEPVDTAAILNDYYLTRIYSDTAIFKYGKLMIRDTVTQNKLRGRRVLGVFDSIPIITKTVTTPLSLRSKVYIGFDIGSNGTTTLGAGPTLLLQTKKDQLYNIGVDFIPGLNGAYYHLGTLWKIHF